MQTLSFWKKPLYSSIIFFGTLIILSIGYGLVGGLSTADKVGSGSGLTATSWNRIVDGILDLDTRVTSITGKFGTMTAGQWCTSDGTKVICTTNAPVGGAGVGQTWQNFTASTRALGTVYTNTTGKPITVIAGATNWSASAICIASIGGVTVYGMGTAVTGTYSSMTFIVPDGASYSFTMNGTPTWFSWAELR